MTETGEVNSIALKTKIVKNKRPQKSHLVRSLLIRRFEQNL